MPVRRGARLCACGLLALGAVSPASAGSAWWQNADQRGDALLQAGDAKAAAGTYQDPRRKAYAELQSGDYAKAAEAYSGFDDTDAHYNRGYALTQDGKLQEALDAFDTALDRDPNNQDARRNRDLVAEALKNQPKSPSQKGDSSQQKSSAQKDKQQDAGQQGEGQQGEAQYQNADGQNSGQNPGQQDGQHQPQQTPSSGDQKGAQDPQQAQRDAETALRQAQRQANEHPPEARQDQAEQGSQDGSSSEQAQAPPEDADPQGSHRVAADELRRDSDEQRLAQEQWLRRIPDDPGGLLRRKFLIEHMMRQQQGETP